MVAGCFLIDWLIDWLCGVWCSPTDQLFPRAVYDDALGHVVEWRCAIQQQLTEIIHIPARNVAMETALAAAARMVRYRYFALSLSG